MAAGDGPGDVVAVAGAVHVSKAKYPFDLYIDWISATRFLKNQKAHIKAAEAWAKLLSRGTLQTATEILANVTKIGREQLRASRVRLDALMCIVWRAFIATMFSSDEPPSFYLYTDASPQLRGIEILATTLDIRWRGNWFRCLLPVVSLSRTMLDVVGKAIALVRQLFLFTGPSFTTLKKSSTGFNR